MVKKSKKKTEYENTMERMVVAFEKMGNSAESIAASIERTEERLGKLLDIIEKKLPIE